MTPKEIALRIDGRVRARRLAQNDRAWLAWHIAALSRAKRLPRIERLLGRRERPQQTWQQQLAIAHQWAAVTTPGG